jgi:hypothetical protein
MSKRLAHFLLILSTAMVWCPVTHGQTIVPGTPAFCTNRTGELYCLLPILFAEANPNPFTPITSAFATQLTQLPLASPASGIIYVYDPRSGVPKRSGQETYGPVLTERGDTMGRDRLFVSFTYQRFTFSSIDGIGLGDINVVFNVCSVTGQCAPIGTTDKLSLTVNQYAFFGTFGLTNRIDISAAFPINSVSESAAGVSCNPCNGPYDFSNPNAPIQYVFQPASASGSKTGLGDVVFRVKGQILSHDKYKLALGSDFRAPTGDELNFLGSGAPGVRPFVAFSRGGTFSVHANLAWQWNGNSLLGSSTAGSSAKLPNDFFYSGGLDWAIAPKLTLAADYLGDYVSDQFRLKRAETTTSPGTQVPDVAVVHGNFNTAKGSIGLKLNPVKNLLVTGNVLVRFDHNGLRNNPVPLAGISYTF